MDNQELTCDDCDKVIAFIDGARSIHETVVAYDNARKSHKCGSHPRDQRINEDARERWANALGAIAHPLTEREYLLEQIRWCWEEIAQLNGAVTGWGNVSGFPVVGIDPRD